MPEILSFLGASQEEIRSTNMLPASSTSSQTGGGDMARGEDMASQPKHPHKSPPSIIPFPRIALGIAAAVAASLIASRIRKYRKPCPSLPNSLQEQQQQQEQGIVGLHHPPPDAVFSLENAQNTPGSEDEGGEPKSVKIDNMRLEDLAGVLKVNNIQLIPPNVHGTSFLDIQMEETQQKGPKNGEIHQKSNETATNTDDLQPVTEVEEKSSYEEDESQGDMKLTELKECRHSESQKWSNKERELRLDSNCAADYCQRQTSEDDSNHGGSMDDKHQEFHGKPKVEENVMDDRREDPIHGNISESETKQIYSSCPPAEKTLQPAAAAYPFEELCKSFTGSAETSSLQDIHDKVHNQTMAPQKGHPQVPSVQESPSSPPLPDFFQPQQVVAILHPLPNGVFSENPPFPHEMVHVVQTKPIPKNEDLVIEQHNQETVVVREGVDNVILKQPAGLVKLNGIQLGVPDLEANSFVDLEVDDKSREPATVLVASQYKEKCLDHMGVETGEGEQQTDHACSELQEPKESYFTEDYCKKEIVHDRSKDGGGSHNEQEFLENAIPKTQEMETFCREQEPIHENVSDLKTEHASVHSFATEKTLITTASPLSHDVNKSAQETEVQESYKMDNKLHSQDTDPEKDHTELPSFHIDSFGSENGHPKSLPQVSPHSPECLESKTLQQEEPFTFCSSTVQAAFNNKPEDTEHRLSSEGESFSQPTATGENEEATCQLFCDITGTKNERAPSPNSQSGLTKHELELGPYETRSEKESSSDVDQSDFISNQPDNTKTQNLQLELYDLQDEKSYSSEVERKQEGLIMKEREDLAKTCSSEMNRQGLNIELCQYSKEPVQTAGPVTVQHRIITYIRSQLKVFFPIQVSFICLLIALMSIVLWYLRK